MIINFFKNKFTNPSEEKKIDDNRIEIINIMALLIEASSIDGKIEEIETSRITMLISNYFNINQETAIKYYDEAFIKQKENISFHDFTSKIHKSYTYEQKVNILEMIWEIVLVNKNVHDFESSFIRRISGLLHLKDIDSGIAKKRIMKKLQIDKT